MPDEDDLVNDLHLLFDFDADTCIDVEETIFVMEFLRINMVIPQLIEGGLVRVYFNQTTECAMRKVSYQSVRLLNEDTKSLVASWGRLGYKRNEFIFETCKKGKLRNHMLYFNCVFALQLVYEFKNSTRCEQRYAESCDLMTSGNGTSTFCEYKCHCRQDGCQIVLYQEQPGGIGSICEIVYLWN